MTDSGLFQGIALTAASSLSEEMLALCTSITAKRPRTVIEHILKHGIITNEDLSDLYGYDHPPRAIRDVRETGIPLITHRIISPKTGRKIGAYTFDDVTNIKKGRVGGRRAFPKAFKAKLVEVYGAKEAFTGEALAERYLQIDHRIPYEVAGDADDYLPEHYMLIDASSQRSKSWSCEHCVNLIKIKDPNNCKTCFWASPEVYSHIAMENIRRVEIVWRGDEVADFTQLSNDAKQQNTTMQAVIKQRLLKKK